MLVGRANHSSPASQTITSVIPIKVSTGIFISSSRLQITAISRAPNTSSTSGSGQKNDSVSWLANQMVYSRCDRKKAPTAYITR